MDESFILSDSWRSGQSRWSDLPLSQEELARFLQGRAQALASIVNERAREERAAALYLVCCCLQELPGALRHLLREYVEPAKQRLKDEAQDPLFPDVLQEFLGALCRPEKPLLAQYRGGSLKKWLSQSLQRRLWRAQGKQRREPRCWEAAEPEVLNALQPESLLLSAEATAALRLALADAVCALPRDDRRLLRQRFRYGLTQEQSAQMMGQGWYQRRVARALEYACQRLHQGTLTRLRDAGMTSDANWLVAQLREHMEFRLSEVLPSTSGSAAPRRPGRSPAGL